MTRQLESLFGFDKLDPGPDPVDPPKLTVEETKTALSNINVTIDKVEAALPMVKDLDKSDDELDEIAKKAMESFENLSDLGMNVDSRFSSEIFAVAGNMLGHALTAKTTKLNKKLKMIDLQLKKLKLDQDKSKNAETESVETAHGQVLSRNDLLERLLSARDQKDKDA
jgi:hypothetical protein